MTPTELGNAFATMTLPQDNSWYMVSGATAHMTNSSGTLMPLFKLSTLNHILVGNGYGQSSLPTPHPPLALHDALFTPQIIKILISIRKFYH